MRNFQGRWQLKPANFAFEDAEALDVALFGLLKERLHAETNAQKGPVSLNPLPYRGVELGRSQRGDAVAQSSNTWKDESGRVRRSELFRRTHHLRGCPNRFERFGDAAEVADSVVDHSNHAAA